jgi:hypothetical protein
MAQEPPPVGEPPPPPPLQIREGAALPLRLGEHREEVDGYIVETVELHGNGFLLTIPGSPVWRWEVVDGRRARGTRVGLEEATFTVEVFPASQVFPERPMDPWMLGGYLEGLRLAWERHEGHSFETFLNTSADEGSLLRATGPVIYDQFGNPRGNAGRLRREKLWGFPYQQIGYTLIEEIEVENAETGEPEIRQESSRYLEWWVEAPEWTARARFVSSGTEAPEGLQRVVENQLKAMLFIPLANPPTDLP